MTLGFPGQSYHRESERRRWTASDITVTAETSRRGEEVILFRGPCGLVREMTRSEAGKLAGQIMDALNPYAARPMVGDLDS